MDSLSIWLALATVCATFLGPIFAVQAQKWLEAIRERQARRHQIFRTLMATRAARLSPAHVEALNLIPIDFQGAGHSLKDVRDAWQNYLSHLDKDPQATGAIWTEKGSDLFYELLQKISKNLNYDFNKSSIEKVYIPKAHVDLESDNETIRKGMKSVFTGHAALPMEIRKFPETNS